jgi:hypothetical protein
MVEQQDAGSAVQCSEQQKKPSTQLLPYLCIVTRESLIVTACRAHTGAAVAAPSWAVCQLVLAGRVCASVHLQD